jgi:hypothetical protein
VCRLEREQVLVRSGQVIRRAVEVSDALTSAPLKRADAAALVRDARGHWHIENGRHRVRAVVLDEDCCQIRCGAATACGAARRNLVLALLRRAGYASVAAALRTLAARPHQAAALVSSGGAALMKWPCR